MLTRTTGWYLENIPTHAGFGPSWAIKNISTCGSLTKHVGKFFFFSPTESQHNWDPRISDLTWEPKLFTHPEDYKMLTNVPQRNRFWRPLTWQSHSLRQLELSADCQALKTAWQAQSFKGFQIEVIPKRHVLHIVEIITECQTPKTAWQVHSLKGLVKIMNGWISRFEDHLAKELLACSGWAWSQTSSSEDPLAISLLPTSEWHFHIQMSSSEDPRASTLRPAFQWNQSKMPISAPSGKLTCLDVWMTSQWKVNSCRSSGNALKSSWQVQFLKGFVWEVTKSEAHLASSLLPVSGWSQTSSSEGHLASSPHLASGWTWSQKSSSEGHLGKSLPPSFGWNHRQISSFEDCSAKERLPCSCWT